MLWLQSQTSCRLTPTVSFGGTEEHLKLSNPEKRKYWYHICLCPYSVCCLYSECPYHARAVKVCKQWHISSLYLGVSIKHTGGNLEGAAFSWWQDAGNRWYCQQSGNWHGSRRWVCLPEATASAHARKASGTDLGTIPPFLPASDMASFSCVYLTKRNHREEGVRSFSLTFNSTWSWMLYHQRQWQQLPHHTPPPSYWSSISAQREYKEHGT